MDPVLPSLISPAVSTCAWGRNRKNIVASAVENRVLLFGCEVFPRCLNIESEVFLRVLPQSLFP